MKTKIIIWALFSLALLSCNKDDDSGSTSIVDLEATSITFSIEKETDFAGTATITGTVTNIGTSNYESGDGQQVLYLYERQLGGTAPGTLVIQVNFTKLAAGASIEITYTRAWDSSSPSEG
jgi:hypothetical protein